MKIPFVDLKAQYRNLKPQIDDSIASVINETAFIGGKYVSNFEESFANLYGVKNCISVANGTDSLFIIMKMLGIKEGDEVITVANSWISSSETISLTGAKVRFVDVELDYYSIDTNNIEAVINEKTRAIIVVHLYGQVCDMEKILGITKRYNLFLIEDCAQSHFSEFKQKYAGTFGIAGSFSFFPGKNLGAYGDAGAIITNDDELALKCRMFARHGALIKHQHQIEGINSRMDSIQAAILSVKLPFILDWTAKRREAANLYCEKLVNIDEVILPKVRADSKHSYHLFVIRVKRRAELQLYLLEQGIETLVHYPKPLPFLEAYKYLGHSHDDFPIVRILQDEILSLPIYPELTVEQIDYICNHIKIFYGK